MELFYIVFFMIQGIVCTLTVKFFHDIYFRDTYKGSPKARFIAYFIMALESFIVVYFETHMVINCIMFLIVQITPISLVKTKPIQKFISCTLCMSLLSVSESLFCSFCSLLMGLDGELPSSRSLEAIIMICGSRLIGLILVYCYKNLSMRKKSPAEVKMNITQGGFYIFNSFLAVITAYFLVIMVLPLRSGGEIETAIIFSTLVMFFLITNFISFIHNLDLQEYRTQALLLNQKMEKYSHEHQMLGEYLKEISILKHDVKHQLLPILAKIPEENQNILEEVSSVFDTVFNEEYIYFSNYSFLDLLLNHQLYKAKRENINFEINIESNINISVEADIFSVILGNLLDNARDSQSNILDKEKNINLKIFSQNTNLFLKVENPFVGEIMLEQGLPVTTKPKSQQHGLGLSTVKKLVERDGGVFQFSTENQTFVVDILLLNLPV